MEVPIILFMITYNRILIFLIIILGLVVRIYNISNNPPSLYWDEVSLGYNAFSILTSSRDEHGEFLPVGRFIAFGDFKPPGYIYATVPSIAFFGVSEFAVRFPSVGAGILLIFATYLITLALYKNKKVALISSFLVSISPWAIQLSRGAFEANLAALFNIIGLYFFLKVKKDRLYLFPLSILFFILSFYTFNANRIIAPLMLGLLFIYRFKTIIVFKKTIIFSIVLAVILLLPSYNYLISGESKIRFQEVSIFTNLEILKTSNQRIETHNNSLAARIIHNRRIAYFREFLDHFFDHFKADYLFISGDKNPRLSTGQVGIFYFFEFIFLVSGIFMLIRKKVRVGLLIGSCMVVSLIPSSVAKETPHALRTISAMPYFYIIMSFGFYYTYNYLKRYLKVTASAAIFSLSYVAITIYYLHILFISYPFEWAGEWQFGYKQAVEAVNDYQKSYDYVVVSQSLGRPYIYWLFYNHVDPVYYFNNRIATRDWFGFWDVDGFSKFRFGMDQLDNLEGKILIVGNEGETSKTNILSSIKKPDGTTVFNIGEIEK